MTTNEIVGEQVSIWLRRRDRTATALGEFLGVTQTTASRKLKGDTTWTITDLARTAAFLDVPLGDLLPSIIVEQEKAKRPIFSDQALDVVAGAGFEPTTSGL
ncbi:helix-turn-helix domain-containing protein [Schaalia turicensis]|uniref:helix-turn-helix domain-containing protein n=1 Tax=Schaalia turicensis TaxID=131111 RepID=UPI0034A52493